MSSLPYFVADTLGMDLYETGDEFFGEDKRLILLGPWRIPIKMQAHCDFQNQKECNVWVSFSRSLWAYVSLRDLETYFLVVDAEKLGITRKNMKKFGGVEAVEVVKQIKDSITAAFHWKRDVWSHVELDSCKL